MSDKNFSDNELIETYLLTENDFWKNVQEPSQRVRDPFLLARLASLSFKRFDDQYVRAAATVNLLYRAIEPQWAETNSVDELLRWSSASRNGLNAGAGFSDCRWYLSLCLAQTAFALSRKEPETAANILREAEPLFNIAFINGQLFTNVVKVTLVRLALGARTGLAFDEFQMLKNVAKTTLGMSNAIPINYKFSNQYAYEEVSYVYGMMRQIFCWNEIANSDVAAGDLRVLEQNGFNWKCVGGPFKSLI